MDFSVIVQEKDSDVMVKILPDLRTWAVQTQGSWFSLFSCWEAIPRVPGTPYLIQSFSQITLS